MPLAEIALTNFRNHAATSLGSLSRFNLLTGENGAGKTNVLEALSLLAPGRGLRRANLADMASASGDGSFAVTVRAAGDDDLTIGTGTLPGRIGRRITRINGAESSVAKVGEWFATSWLTPTMDRLFTDSAGARRRFVDRLVLAIEPGHARNASRYEAALRERNRLLAADAMPETRWFAAVEAQLAQHGSALAAGRARLVDALGTHLASMPSQPFARPELALDPGGPVEADILAHALASGRQRDRAAGRTLIGPHRAELLVTLSSKNVPAAQASTGEQKALLIAIILAHLELALRQRPGLLLLDEVAAHLDPIRRAALFERLADMDAQIWLTGTETAPFSALPADAARWRVVDGGVFRL